MAIHLSDASSNTPFCEPCQSQYRQNMATHWCAQCQEVYCMACTDYHKILKSTRDHKIITYKEYDYILEVLPLLQTTCKTHKEKEIKYVCKNHDVLCCGLCKIGKHTTCKMEKLEDMTFSTNIERTSDILLKSTEQIIEIINDICAQNSEKTQEVNRLCELIINVNKKKEQIYLLLKNLDAKLTFYLEQYQVEKQQLQAYEGKLSKRRAEISAKRDKLLSLLQVFDTSSVNRLVLEIQISQCIKQDEIFLLSTIEEKKQEYKQTLKANTLEALIELFNSIASRLTLESTSMPDSNITENSSSTVEAENEFSVFEHSKQVDTCVSPTASASDNMVNLIAINNQNYDHVTLNTAESCVQENFTFQYQFYFKERKKVNIEIRCAKVLTNGHILIGESSEPRLMIYAKQGYRQRVMKLTHAPESIAIIDTRTVAVTLNTMALVVNVNTATNYMQVTRKIELQDNCYGLTYVDNMLIVNCQHSGLKLVSLDGRVLQKTFPLLTGIFNMCSDHQNNLLFVNPKSECIKIFNLSSEESVDFNCPNMCGANGIAVDRTGNVFVTCDKTNTVNIIQKESKNVKCILSKCENIDQPWGLDYDRHSGELVVINHRGKSVYVYKTIMSF